MTNPTTAPTTTKALDADDRATIRIALNARRSMLADWPVSNPSTAAEKEYVATELAMVEKALAKMKEDLHA